MSSSVIQHSLPVPEEAKTSSAIAAHRRLGGDDESRAAFKKSRRRNMILMVLFVVAFMVLVGVMVAVFTSSERNSKSQPSSSVTSTDTQTTTTPPTTKPPSTTNTTRPPSLSPPLAPQPANNSAPSGGDSEEDVYNKVISLLRTFTSIQVLTEEGTPQNLAVNWMVQQVIHNDRVTVPGVREYQMSFQFVQRYIMAVVYYALDGPNWKDDLNFMSDDDTCKWNKSINTQSATFVVNRDGSAPPETIFVVAGVDCNARGEINYILIPDNQLDGELPVELGLLEGMEHFSVYLNTISGPLPESIKLWKKLSMLILENNRFTGNLPTYMDEWPNLDTASFAHNQFTGDIPSFAASTKLRSLALSDNLLTGSINEVFDSNLSLEMLYLQDNDLTGQFNPVLMARLKNLKLLDCSNNQISGQLESHWYSVEVLNAHNNLLTGNLPEVVDDIRIRYLSVYSNQMSGQIPDSVGDLLNLYHLDISKNGFTGSIPTTMSNLANLQYVFLGDNMYDSQDFPYFGNSPLLQELSMRNCNITDRIPHYFGNWLDNLVLLDLSDNSLSGDIVHNLGLTKSPLRFLLLGSNNLTGTVPLDFQNFFNMSVLTLDHNQELVFFVADGDEVFFVADGDD